MPIREMRCCEHFLEAAEYIPLNNWAPLMTAGFRLQRRHVHQPRHGVCQDPSARARHSSTRVRDDGALNGGRDNEEKLLRSVALKNARSILRARQCAERELIDAKEALERKTAELVHSLATMRATLELQPS